MRLLAECLGKVLQTERSLEAMDELLAAAGQPADLAAVAERAGDEEQLIGGPRHGRGLGVQGKADRLDQGRDGLHEGRRHGNGQAGGRRQQRRPNASRQDAGVDVPTQGWPLASSAPILLRAGAFGAPG